VTKIQTDPAPGNRRAIRCYQKAGFVQDRLITTPDVPAVYTMQTRQAFIRRQRCGGGSTGAPADTMGPEQAEFAVSGPLRHLPFSLQARP
jgi:hypothetical protein